ncbi:CAP domain-containing protein [Kordia sp.]|uniref:CAP domain-containing protein n=1 Tax=Kordia sp. TaxID=1965332 RepID=UPI0025C210B6|nr:CAP domain-containing protein [Kordia sp.]MCH2193236.1 CAP domain-containing protein [Kordia sp.]
MKNSMLALIVCFITFGVSAQKLTQEEQKLYDLLMEYRKENNLPPIPLSKSLTFVAQTHVKDLHNNNPNKGKTCNMHSWSDKGNWTACCYTRDHKKAACMWNKPRELTSYQGHGFEIAYGSTSKRYMVNAEDTLEGWKKSSAHNKVILNIGKWKNSWNAIGVGMYKNYAVVWFGKVKDE